MCYMVVHEGSNYLHEDMSDAIKTASIIAEEFGIKVDVYQRVRVVKVETKTVVEEV